MTTMLKDLEGQRSMTIDTRESTVFLDFGMGSPCYEFDKAILLRALRQAFGLQATCGVCKVALALTA